MAPPPQKLQPGESSKLLRSLECPTQQPTKQLVGTEPGETWWNLVPTIHGRNSPTKWNPPTKQRGRAQPQDLRKKEAQLDAELSAEQRRKEQTQAPAPWTDRPTLESWAGLGRVVITSDELLGDMANKIGDGTGHHAVQ